MTTTQFNTLVQMIATLSARIEVIAENQKNFITKDDAKMFATKEDLKRFATKEDLKNFATKKDLERFATKEELKNLATKRDLSLMGDTLLDAISSPFVQLETKIDGHETRLKNLENKGKLLRRRSA